MKKATIEIVLIEESSERINEELEDEILEELLKQVHVIPWAARIESVRVKGV